MARMTTASESCCAQYGICTRSTASTPGFGGDSRTTRTISRPAYTRVAAGGLANECVVECTTDLIGAARDARLDLHEDARLPDLALLAMLQHHGAATPLLDVSLDPLVALYMAVVSPNPADDDNDGVLFAIRRPQSTLMAFDSGPFNEVYNQLPDDAAVLYTAPDVSERLRIQRGHFLLAKVADKFRTTLPLTIDNPSQGLANADLQADGGAGSSGTAGSYFRRRRVPGDGEVQVSPPRVA